MRIRESKRSFINLILTVLLITFFLGSGNTVKTYAEDGDTTPVTVSVSVSQLIDGIGSDGNKPVVTVDAGGLGEGDYTSYLYYKVSSSGSYSNKNQKLSNEGTATFNGYPSLANGKTYDLYVEIRSEGEVVAKSENVTINAVKPSLSNSISSTNSIEGQSTGTISVTGDYQYIAYYPNVNGASISSARIVTGTTITGLEAGDYYVFVPAYSSGSTYYIKSSAVKVTVGETPAAHYKVTLNSDEYSSWAENDNDTVEVIQGYTEQRKR